MAAAAGDFFAFIGRFVLTKSLRPSTKVPPSTTHGRIWLADVALARRRPLPRSSRGRPLLLPVMRPVGGARRAGVALKEAQKIMLPPGAARLPEHVRAIAPKDPPFPAEVSAALRADQMEIRRQPTS